MDREEILRRAQELIKLHGDDAWQEADRIVDRISDTTDVASLSDWKRIRNEIYTINSSRPR